jgi:hypothetical protein
VCERESETVISRKLLKEKSRCVRECRCVRVCVCERERERGRDRHIAQTVEGEVEMCERVEASHIGARRERVLIHVQPPKLS